MVDKPMHGAVGAVHVLVDHPRDEVGSEGDDKRLRVGTRGGNVQVRDRKRLVVLFSVH